MEDDIEDPLRYDKDANLLRELPHEAILGRFVGLDLPTGKLPVTFEVRAALTLRRENLSLSLEDPRGDQDGVSHG